MPTMTRQRPLISGLFYFMEVWKTIKGFENYEVSNYGNVRRQYLKFIKYRKPVYQHGYVCITFSIGSSFKKFQLHRLVADAFIPNNENKPCVNHINGIKHDNRVDNLEWCTFSENERHSYDVLGKKSNGVMLRKIPIDDIETIKKMNLNGITQRNIAKIYNVSQSCIHKIIINKTYTKWI